MSGSSLSINARIAEGRQRLLAAGIDHDEAALDARLLAQHVLGWDATKILTSGEDDGPAGFAGLYEPLIARRVAREPLAYITGTREFWNFTVEVTPAVLIPRPETEGLVEEVLQLYADPSAAIRAIDVCTGSGCIAVALARERPRAHIVATDNSEAALGVARRNVLRNDVVDRVECVLGDLLEPATGTFHVIVANPPYIPEITQSELPPEVREFEPAQALFGGRDGLAVIRRLVASSVARLKPNGFLIFEFGEGQDREIRQLISNVEGLRLVAIKTDLQGIPRVAVARRTESPKSNAESLL